MARSHTPRHDAAVSHASGTTGGPDADRFTAVEDFDPAARDVAARGARDNENAPVSPARTIASGLAGFARAHPIGTALTVTGAALLLAPAIRPPGSARHARPMQARTQDVADSGDESLRETAGTTNRVARARLARMRDRIHDGTETLSAAARDRVVAARMRTIAARERALDDAARLRTGADTAARRGGHAARAKVRDHPLATAALALAAGGIVGVALPGTRAEDNRFGALSDRIARQGRALYAAERDRVRGAGHRAAHEARDMARQQADKARDAMPDGADAMHAAEDRLRHAGTRVAEAARRR